jgi:hypothetical protein
MTIVAVHFSRVRSPDALPRHGPDALPGEIF